MSYRLYPTLTRINGEYFYCTKLVNDDLINTYVKRNSDVRNDAAVVNSAKDITSEIEATIRHCVGASA